MSVSAGDAFVDIRPNLATFNSEMGAAFAGSSMKSRFGKYGLAAGGALAGGLVAAGIGKMLFDVGEEFDAAFDKIETRTGATGKRMDRLKEDFKDVFASVPVSADDAATALSGLAQRMDLPDRKLRSLTKQVLALSKITGTDVQENVESISRLFGDWSISTGKQADTLDRMFRLTQVTGIEFSDLSRLMVQFGSPLRQLGFGFEESAAMFARFEREGVNMQTLLPGLRMALKNIAVPTDDLAGLFKQLGVNTKDPHDALMQIFELLSKDKISETDQTLLASSVFGGRSWADMKAAIEEGRFSFSELIKTMDKGKQTIRGTERGTRDFSEEWQLFTNRLKVAIEPIASGFFKMIGDGMKAISGIIGDRHMNWSQKLSALLDLFTGWLADLTKAAVTAAPKIVGALVRGFLDAPAWAKLAIGGFLVAKMGGWTAIKGLGARIGGSLFGGIFGSKVPGTTGGTVGGTLAQRGSTPANPVFVSIVGPGNRTPTPGTTIPGRPGPIPEEPLGPEIGGRWFSNIATRNPLATAGGIALGIQGFAEAGAPGVQNTPGNKLNAFAHGADPTRVLHLIGLPAVSDLLPGIQKNPTNDVVAIMRNAFGIPDIRHPLDLPKHTELGAAGETPPISEELFKAAMENVKGLVTTTDVSGGRISDIVDSLRAKYGSLAEAASNMTKTQAHSFLSLAAQAKTPKPVLANLAESFAKAGKLSGDDIKQLAKITGESAAQIRGSISDTRSKATSDLRQLAHDGGKSFRDLSKDARTRTATLGRTVTRIIGGMVDLVSGSGGFGTLEENVNNALKGFGLGKGTVHFSIKKAAKAAGSFLGGIGGSLQSGGLAGMVPGADTGDRHVLTVDGSPIASVAGSEGIFVGNSRMMRALHLWNRLLPRRREGGAVEQALGPYTIPPIQYDPGHAGSNSHLHLDFFTQGQAIAYGKKMQGMGWTVGEYSGPYSGFGPLTVSHQSAGHYDGTAFDANTAQDETRAQVAAVARLLGGASVALGGGIWKDIPRIILGGPKGRTRDLGQRALDKAWRQANAFGRRKAASRVGTGVNVKGLGGGALSKGEIRELLRAHGMPDIMGYVSYAESGFNPNAQNALYKGLWAEGSPFWDQFGGNKFGPWIPNVFDPNAAAAVASAGYRALGLSPWEASRNAGAGGGWGSHLGQAFRRGGQIPWLGRGADFVARSPQVIGVGDGPRPERVTVEPLGGGGRRFRARIVNWAQGWAEIEEIAVGAANDAVTGETRQISRTNRMSRSGRGG